MPCRAPASSLETLEKAVDQVIQGFTAAPPPAPPISTRAKTQLVASRHLSPRQPISRWPSAYGQALMIGLTVDDVNEWPARIRAVSAEGVRKAAAGSVKRKSGDRLSDAGRRANEARLLAACIRCLAAGCWRRVRRAPPTSRTSIWARMREVWFAEDHTVPIVAFNISLPAGSAYDPAGKAGLAAFAAAMIDEGAGNMDSKAFHEALADRAIQFRASAERDYLVISVVTPERECCPRRCICCSWR